ncbi:prepilin-type N-terminal cleavage/methylation domain-containing protein [Oceanimonas pelagia]|uniref:Prepilin-type N-terminal cleavage/methylation domain-containing protein n=1 Tax=Oceanimonas pelagia TaxID=3028314 RepID=A0AA50Q8T8_9GAMM|nr:prepilin-type N-terminal cleavage/methylation domain-containing protein [Oceanimonas pelagia]WMC12295.1 prepilin-type N-terminal cleavage/methylation domain-containing protein [Oceanimonas pelagia]
MLRRNAGLSLLEYVVGLAILAIVLVGAGLFFLSQPRQLDPVFQFRAVALAEALAEQVLAVKYDAANNPRLQIRCDIDEDTGCVNSATAEEHSGLNSFKHVDDFNLWCDENAIDGDELANEENLKLASPQLYRRYRVATCVTSEDDSAGTSFKKVVITIADQNGSDLSFTLHRYNIR